MVLKACGSYEELVEDAGVELVYIATPHSHHYEHIKCAEPRKACTVRKSFTVNESQAREVLELAVKKLLLTEAIWTRYMPMRKTLDDVLLSGVIGRPYMLTANLGYIISGKERIMRPELAEGPFGCGNLPKLIASMVFGDEVGTITGTAVMTETGVDAQNSITITYKDGRMAVLCGSAMGLSDRRGIIYGDNGFIEVENINNCEGIRIYDRSRNMIASYDTPKQISGYEYEVEACLRAIEEERWVP
ncbi:MAG: Gfo/Idh/MocA family protein [Enterocloster clostridioformis]